MSTVMRAKMVVGSVEQFESSETLKLRAVYKTDAYADDGLDEDNTFSLFTPAADLTMTVTNPAVVGKIKVGQTFYVDFTEAPE